MDRFPILDNAGIFPQFEALYRDFLRTLIGESTPTDDDVARFMQAMVDAEAVFTQNFSTNDPRDLDEDDNDNADEDDSDALESDSEDEDDNEELTEDEDDVDEGTQTVRFYTSAGAPKARPHGYGIELTFASGYVPSSKCVCEKWKNHNATPTENSLMSPKKRKHNNSANDSNAMDAHARNYIPLLHVYQWLHAQTEAKCQKGKIPLDNLRRAIPNLKISDKSAVDTKDVSQTQTPTTHTQPNVATRHRAKAMFRHIFLSSQPLLNGHQPAALTSLLTSANTTAVCPHLALAAAPLPKPCRCVKQAYIGWFHHGERVRGISVFADGGALEKSEVSASFVYHHEDGRTSIYVAAGGETAVGVSSDVKESSGADNEDTANDDGEDGEDVDDEDEDGNEDEGAEVDDEDNAGEGDEDEDGDEDEEEDVASVVIERDSTGAITFAGRAVGGVKHGAGAFAAGDGALFLGNWHRGEFSCDEGSWLIPSGNCHLGVQLQQLQGSKHPAEDKVATVKDDAAEKAPVVLAYYHGAWRKGRAVDTRTLIYEHAAPLTSPSLAAKLLAADKDTVKYDISSPTRISRTPMQPDAWESVWVRVCNSKINLSPAGTAAAGAAEKVEEEADKATAKNKGAKRGAAAAASKDAKKPRIVAGDAVAEAAEEVLQNLDAGEGLVAARLIPKGTIVAWYNGTRPSTKEVSMGQADFISTHASYVFQDWWSSYVIYLIFASHSHCRWTHGRGSSTVTR